MSADLNQLNDAELSAVFAVEVAGHKPMFLLVKRGYYFRPEAKGYVYEEAKAGRFTEAEARDYVDPSHGEVTMYADKPPVFATSMDAVLPYFEKRAFNIEHFLSPPSSYVIFIYQKGDRETLICEDTSLPRAACIALILAARAEKEAAK